MTDVIEVRQGDTFKARGVYKSDGVPVDLTLPNAVVIKAFVTGTNFKEQISVTPASDGTFMLRSNTNDWPLGRLGLFLRYITPDGDKTSSPLMQVFVNDGYN